MGLDTTHECWHGSYSSFNAWRRWLAGKAGFDLDSMLGFGGHTDWSTVSSGLVPLLNHSDCDGEISPDDAALIAPALDEVVENATEQDEPWMVERARQFSRGCKVASSLKEHIEFH